ncbi:glutamate-cysteine ligase family protein [Kitasatospora sp. NPDC056273]|uniref:glutamate-cysteine ligase family protein n=1 Tax=Kitasatospora sp. NPDC056273 TaxID=3345769 RepID=UPI0035E20632
MGTAGLGRDELRSLLEAPAAASERIGLEIECGVVDPRTGLATPYPGRNGMRAVLEAVLAEWDGKALFDAGRPVGVELADGGLIGLEHGGQLEYSGPPTADLAAAVDDVRLTLVRLAELLRRFDLALLPGAYLPFDRIETVPWVPLSRGPILREHFESFEGAGSGGVRLLPLSTCTQVHLDHLSEDDFTQKLRMQAAASPVVAALLVNSPLYGGRLDGLLSHRCRDWLLTDPQRCGLVRPALHENVGIDDVVDWALDIPMVFYQDRTGGLRPAPPDRPFASLLRDGFADGTRPLFSHWVAHLAQIWTHVRVRRTLELRAADGPAYQNFQVVPALWTGLSYHAPSRAAAWELLRHYSVGQLQAAEEDFPSEGLRTMLGGDRVHELAGELVRLAREGLRARVAAGLERPEAPSYLDPLDEVLHTGRTFAEQCARLWETDLQRDPRRYVAHFRV